MDNGHPKIIILSRDTNKIRDSFKLLTDNPEFRRDIFYIRKKLGININKPRLTLVEGGDKEIVYLLEKYNLHNGWRIVLSTYIIFNKFEIMFDPEGIQIRKNTNEKFLDIRLPIDITSRQMRALHKNITTSKGINKINKDRKATKIERDTFIYNLKTVEGKKNSEIIKLVYENYVELLDSAHISRIVYKIKNKSLPWGQ